MTELELRVGDDDAPGLRFGASELIERERDLFELLRSLRPERSRHIVLAHVHVVSGFGFRRGGEERLFEPIREAHPFRQRDAADASRLLVLLPSRAVEISANHALEGNRRELADQHRPGSKLVLERLEPRGKTIEVPFDHVIRHDSTGALEPVQRELVQYLAFVSNARGKNDVERGDPIGGHDEKHSVDFVDVADLASRAELEPVETSIDDNVIAHLGDDPSFGRVWRHLEFPQRPLPPPGSPSLSFGESGAYFRERAGPRSSPAKRTRKERSGISSDRARYGRPWC